MVFMSAYLNRVAFQFFANAAYVVIKIVFDLLINQIFSVFGTEYDMCVNFG